MLLRRQRADPHTAHFTVLFPFCEPNHLDEAAVRLREACSRASLSPIPAVVDHVDTFSMRSYETVYLAPSSAASATMKAAWRVAADTFSYVGRDFVPHMTLGQAPVQSDDALDFLTSKGDALVRTGLEWTIDCFVILRKDESDGGRMKIAHIVPFGSSALPLSIVPEVLPASAMTSADAYVPTTTADVLRVATYNILEDGAFPSLTRLPPVVQALLESKADIVALQEVSDSTLRVLLSDPSLQATYHWCPYEASSVLPLSRNVVILSKASIPFRWMTLDLGDKHKPALIAIVERSSGLRLIVAAVHFSAGYNSEISAKRSREFNNLVTFLRTEWPDDDWIVLGDTNLQPSDGTGSPAESLLDDVWEVLGSPTELAPTFDPTMNALAAQTSRQDKSPKRYDRIYIRRGRFTPSEFARFGIDSSEPPASDHWGIAVSVAAGTHTPPATVPVPTAVVSLRPPIVSYSLSDAQLHEAATRYRLLLDDAAIRQRQRAVESLRELLCPSGTGNVCIRLASVGSFALGVSVPSSDVDCLAVGNISGPTFWQLSRERIRALGWPNEAAIRLRRFVREAAVQMMELEVHGIKVDLQYCAAPQVAERFVHSAFCVTETLISPSWDTVSTLPSTSPLFSLPVSTLRTLNAFRDANALTARVPTDSRPAFHLAHRSLRHFCKMRGIFASKYGYFGSFHLSILVVRLLEQLTLPVTAAQIVETFISQYSQWDWEKDALHVGSPREYSRSTREAMVILSPEKPSLNISSSASRNSVQTISLALADAERLLRDGATWDGVCGTGLPGFLAVYETYVKIDVSYWGPSSMAGRGLVGHLESRFVHVCPHISSPHA